MENPRQSATGRIKVTSFDPKPYDSVGTFTLSEVNVTEEFSGGLEGVGTVRFLMATEPGGTAHFTGMEHFVGSLGDRSGSFLMGNSGAMKDSELHSAWRIIPGSGTDGFIGLQGEGGCHPEGYVLDYWFEESPRSEF